jgi:uncharacterized protein (DUF885 family)
MKAHAGAVTLLGAGILLAAAGLRGAGGETSPSDGPQILHRVEDQYWDHVKQEDLGLRLRLGLPIEALPDVSEPHAAHEADFARRLLSELSPVEEGRLPHEDALSLEILREGLQQQIETARFDALTFPVTPYAGPSREVVQAFTTFALKTPEDARRYLKLLDLYPGFIQALEARLRAQAAAGVRLPKDEISIVIPVYTAAMKEGRNSPFFVAPARLKGFSAKDADAFSAGVEEAIHSKIRPALAHLTQYLSGDYFTRAPESVGLGQYPGGREYYAYLARRYTTLDVTPEEIHRIGLEEVARINRRFDEIRRRVGFKGNLEEFKKYLKTDPRFFPKTPEQIGERLMAAEERIAPKIPLYFGAVPKAPYGVRRLAPELEGAMTYGYYQVPTPAEPKGYYCYNGSHLDQRSLLFAAALIYHELVPGHHFQINLQHENSSLPPFRREFFGLFNMTAYLEGWGEYASSLAENMGMYTDPYDLAGRLSMDIFLSSRLVVDTGMNDLGWSRARAIAYMKQNTLESDTQIATETLRYCCDIPGQALAYKMGSRALRRLREKAERALGKRFDIRRFHDAVLLEGAMPLDVLGRHIDWFIAREKAQKPPVR